MAVCSLVRTACFAEHLSYKVCTDRACVVVTGRELHSV